MPIIPLKRSFEDTLARVSKWLGRCEVNTSEPIKETPEAAASVVTGGDGTEIKAVVRALYRLALHRQPTDDDVDYWAAAVASGAISALGLVASIASSPEALAVAAGVELLPGASDGAFVQIVYESILNRGAMPDEIVYWQQRLKTKGLTRESMVLELVRSSLTEASSTVTVDVSHATILGTSRYVFDQWRESESMPADVSQKVHGVGADLGYSIVDESSVLVSAIASLYRGVEYIERFLDNITSQTIFADRCELIIIDANSPENERETIERYSARFPNIRYVRTPNRIGIYEAWNLGVALAKGKYLTNTNLDDLRRKDSFELQARVLESLGFVDIVYQDFFYSLDATLDFDGVARRGVASELPVVTPYNLLHFNSPHNAPMWRRRIHDEVGMFNPAYRSAGDSDFWLRCARTEKCFFKINDPHVGYFLNPRGISTRPDTRGPEESRRISKNHARHLVSRHLVSTPTEFLEELQQILGHPLEVSGDPASRSDWRYGLVQLALQSLSARWSGVRGKQIGVPAAESVPMDPMKIVIDGAIFQLGYSTSMAEAWQAVLAEWATRGTMELVLLDRGGAPALPGLRCLAFPSYHYKYNAADSELLEKLCRAHSADLFLSTMDTTPLSVPSISVLCGDESVRIGAEFTERSRQERELSLSHACRHICSLEADLLDETIWGVRDLLLRDDVRDFYRSWARLRKLQGEVDAWV